ncbi:APC family permease [Scopulibacillus cellulosilyticus]|uniref:APC family permease n=1 Tax=Scopulibacillus cellulosilyticus TaxID=2665665 RepID=A0ABW2PUC4_9BACL
MEHQKTSSSPPTKVKVPNDIGFKRHIGKNGLLFTSVGTIIGSGWLFAAFNAARLAGPAAIISWVLAAIMILVIAIVYSELSVIFPVSGGVIRFPQYSFGSTVSFTGGWLTYISAVTAAPTEVLATLQYSSNYLPWLVKGGPGGSSLSSIGLIIAIGLMALFSLVNVLGVKLFARINNVLVWWKLCALVMLVVILILSSFNLQNFYSPRFGGFAPSGFSSVLEALPAGGIVFSFLGFRQGIEFAAETNNPRRNVPFAVIGSVVLCLILYIGLQVAFIGATPSHFLSSGWPKLSFEGSVGPLASLVTILGIGWLAIIVYIDAIISPADTGLIYASVTARLSYSQARAGNAPQILSKLNKKGVPWISVLLMFIIGCIAFLPFPSWKEIIGFTTSAMILAFGIGPLVFAALRRQLPDQPRKFRAPGSDVLGYAAFLSSNLIVYWTGWHTNSRLFISILIGFILFGIYNFIARKNPSTPPLHLKAASWIPIWLGGLAIISFFGPYDGGLDLFKTGVGELIVAVLSGFVYWMSLALRLSTAETIRNVERTRE